MSIVGSGRSLSASVLSSRPTMARHYGGKPLYRNGEGLKTIMGALDYPDAKSSLRYQDTGQDIVREAMERSY